MQYEKFWGIQEEWLLLKDKIEEQIEPVFKKIREIREHNQLKVIHAFHEARISESSFIGSTGYGHNDYARESVEKVFALALEAEAAFVRPQLCSATQAINLAMFACLRTGDELLTITGKPYDTLLNSLTGSNGKAKEEEEFLRTGIGSLTEYGIQYRQIDLDAQGKIQLPLVLASIKENTKVVYIQRSRGYSTREAIDVYEIGEVIQAIKKAYPQVIVFVDNCYGTFVQKHEPTAFGADLMAGSLIKNAGGGIAPVGAYLVGKKELIEQCGHRLFAPGYGSHVGPYLDIGRTLLLGFYLAPHTVSETLKGLTFSSALFEHLGFETSPRWNATRSDIVQTVTCRSGDLLLRFCQAIQNAAPIDSYLTLEPYAETGYPCDVVMAAGAFVQGSSIELSADGPMREPFVAYMQGGLVYENVKLAGLMAAQSMSQVWKTKKENET